MAAKTDQIRVFAPGSVANLGPGFDVLGLALTEPGDIVTARRVDDAGVRIAAVRGDDARLSTDAAKNTAGIAASEVLRRSGSTIGIELELDKNMPLGSGLGSSAASAAAGAVAANRLVDAPLSDQELVACCVEAEAVVSGRHADNVAASVLGGLVLVRSVDPLDVHKLPVVHGLYAVVVTPKYEVPTIEARAVLPKQVSLELAVSNAACLAAMIHAVHVGDLELLGRSLEDHIVAPARAMLIPGSREVIAAAKQAGALGSSISGAGPSIFALCSSLRVATAVVEAMQAAFAKVDLTSTAVTSTLDAPGARVL